MGLRDILRSGVKTADKILKNLESPVSYKRVLTRDSYGAVATFSSPVTLYAIVDFKAMPVRTKNGVDTTTSAVLTILDAAAVAAATANLGPDTDDEFTLPNGMTGKVLNIGGFMDSGNYTTIPTTVYLG